MPHILGTDDHFVSYRDIYTAFTPTNKLKKGGSCADLRIPDDPKIAIIQKITKRRRGHAITVLYTNPGETDETVAVVASHHCVPLPAVNQFVRHKRSGIWYKIKNHGSMVAMSKVIEKAAPSTSSATPAATTQTPATPAAPQTPAAAAASQTPSQNPSQNPRPPASANTASTQAPVPNLNEQAPASAASATTQTPGSNTPALAPASATVTPPVRGAPPSLQDILSMEPRLVVKDARIARIFIRYHLTVGLPDITDLPEVPHESMLYWKKKKT